MVNVTFNVMALGRIFKRIVRLTEGEGCEIFHSNFSRIIGEIGQRSWLPLTRRMSSQNDTNCMRAEPKALSQKILRVAIVGRPNAGKSTLINSILNMNLCDVSPKTHTTRRLLKTAFIRGDIQIVFVDTPGLITKKEFSRFGLTENFLTWKQNFFNEVDIIGVIHQVTSPKDVLKLHLNLVQSLNGLPETIPMFIILNKIDLVIDKNGLSEAINTVMKPRDMQNPSLKLPNVWIKFSNVFLISALKNIGVAEVVDFLLEQAKPGNWLFEPSVVFDKPLHVLVSDLLRAKVMSLLPHEVPYAFRFEVEYMEENDLGEIICVALIKCEKAKFSQMLIDKKKNSLRRISQTLESDLYKILRKVFRKRDFIFAAGETKKSGDKAAHSSNFGIIFREEMMKEKYYYLTERM